MKFNISLFLLFLNQVCLCQFHNTCISENVFPAFDKSCNNKPLTLFFEDNFDGNTFDLTKWNPVTGVPRDFNFRDQKAWHLPENIEVSNGTLKILTKKLVTPYTGTWVTDWSTSPPTTHTSEFDYTTGEIWTHQTFGYGQYEIRAKLPQGVGFWSAFWTFGGVGWNEIDVFEIFTENPNYYNMNIHYFPNTQMQGSYDCQDDWAGSNFSNAYHTFTMFWDYFKIIWYIDGNLIRTVYKYHNILGQPIDCNSFQPFTNYILNKAFPVEDMKIVLNTAVVSPLNVNHNPPNSSTDFPAFFEIDYIRYWEKTPIPMSCNKDVIKWSPFGGASVGDEGLLLGGAAVNSGTSATITVRNYLSIKPNFTAKAGSYFHAKVDPYICGSSARLDESTLGVDVNDKIQRLIHNPDTTHKDIAQTREDRILVSPNPTEGIIKINNLNQQIGSRLEIFNMMGSKVASLIISENSLLYDFSSQPKGIYLIKIIGGGNDFITKVVYN